MKRELLMDDRRLCVQALGEAERSYDFLRR